MPKENNNAIEIPEELNFNNFPKHLPQTIAVRIEEAISAPHRKPLEDLNSQLTEMLQTLTHIAPIEAIEAMRNPVKEGTTEHAAYILGQVSLAQLIIADALHRRADDSFIPTMLSGAYEKYIKTLYKGDFPTIPLITRVGDNQRLAIEKLRTLRKLGIIDIRSDGEEITHFLTPAARSVVESPNVPEYAEFLIKNIGTAVINMRNQLVEDLNTPNCSNGKQNYLKLRKKKF